MDYIENEKDFFVQFIVGGEDSFQYYLAKKRQDGVWGDDIELQALSEIYNKPIEIYAYNNKPMRTFHEEKRNNRSKPLKLSYHGGQHYNSIVYLSQDKEEEKEDANKEAVQPMTMEYEAVRISKARKMQRI